MISPMARANDKPGMPMPPSVRDRLGFLLAKNHLAFLRQVEAKLDPGGLTGRHFGCLTVIANEGPMTQQRLGERMGVDRTTVVAIVDVLERQGFVERRRNPNDRRAYALQVTPQGARWLKQATEVVLESEGEYLAPLSTAERKQLIELLQRVLMSQPAELLAYPPVEVRPG
jgi:DNA-binding MarR family transcriptional regulator